MAPGWAMRVWYASICSKCTGSAMCGVDTKFSCISGQDITSGRVSAWHDTEERTEYQNILERSGAERRVTRHDIVKITYLHETEHTSLRFF